MVTMNKSFEMSSGVLCAASKCHTTHLAVVVCAKQLLTHFWVWRPGDGDLQDLPVLATLILKVFNDLQAKMKMMLKIAPNLQAVQSHLRTSWQDDKHKIRSGGMRFGYY